MRNHRLEEALRARGITAAALAAAVDVTPKTISRWLADDSCIPHAETRAAVGTHLDQLATDLWAVAGAGELPIIDELLGLYPSRASVPAPLIAELLRSARNQIDIVAISALSVWQSVDGVVNLLQVQARAGVRIRIVLADPEGDSLSDRGAEESIGELVRARAQLAWAAVRALRDVPGVTLAMHDTHLPAAIIRADDDLLVNLHILGLADAAAPVLHLRRQPTGRTAGAYLESLDLVANLARPLAAPASRPRRVNRPRTLRPVAGQSGT